MRIRLVASENLTDGGDELGQARTCSDMPAAESPVSKSSPVSRLSRLRPPQPPPVHVSSSPPVLLHQPPASTGACPGRSRHVHTLFSRHAAARGTSGHVQHRGPKAAKQMDLRLKTFDQKSERRLWWRGQVPRNLPDEPCTAASGCSNLLARPSLSASSMGVGDGRQWLCRTFVCAVRGTPTKFRLTVTLDGRTWGEHRQLDPMNSRLPVDEIFFLPLSDRGKTPDRRGASLRGSEEHRQG